MKLTGSWLIGLAAVAVLALTGGLTTAGEVVLMRETAAVDPSSAAGDRDQSATQEGELLDGESGGDATFDDSVDTDTATGDADSDGGESADASDETGDSEGEPDGDDNQQEDGQEGTEADEPAAETTEDLEGADGQNDAADGAAEEPAEGSDSGSVEEAEDDTESAAGETGPDEGTEHPDNHGKRVSEAAHSPDRPQRGCARGHHVAAVASGKDKRCNAGDEEPAGTDQTEDAGEAEEAETGTDSGNEPDVTANAEIDDASERAKPGPAADNRGKAKGRSKTGGGPQGKANKRGGG